VVLTPEGDVDRPGRLNNLANMKFERFRRWDDLPDLDAAITANQKALTKERHPERATFLNNLSTMLSYRFRRLGEDTDLDCALAAAEEAVLLASDVSPDRPTYLNTLANRLLERFRKGGVISDLDAAIGAARKAADLTPHGNPDRHSYLNNLGMGLGLRFDRLQQKVDLHAAIEFVGEAVVLTPDGNPALPMYLNNLADLLHSRYRQSGEFSDLEAAIAAHKRAIPQLHASVTAEPQLSWLAGQASEHTRKIVGLLWRAGHFTQLAVAIENGRGVRLRADMIRADKAPNGLGEGEVVHFRDLVQQQRRLRAELERLRAPVADVQDFAARTRALDKTAMDSGPAADEISTQSILKEERRRTLLAEKLTLLFRLQEECKALEARDPNFDPPMPSFHELKELASACGDVLVYLLPISEDQGTVWQIISGVNESSEISAADQQLEESFTPGLLHALLANNPAVPGVEPMEPLGWLLATLRKIEVQPADLNVEAHAAAADIRRGTMDHVLAVLGRELISPLAKRLAEIGAKRVVLIPSGLLAFLPLHAAKIDENMTFGDLFEIRYCASATLLARARWLFLVGRQREG
jgi:tetratricopeptide (TPR) repeat protein